MSKQIIRNFVLKEFRQVVPYVINAKYETLTFFVDYDEQTLFPELLSDIKIGDVTKSELYISGVRYNPTDDYNIIDNGTLEWLDTYLLVEGQRCVFIYR